MQVNMEVVECRHRLPGMLGCLAGLAEVVAAQQYILPELSLWLRAARSLCLYFLSPSLRFALIVIHCRKFGGYLLISKCKITKEVTCFCTETFFWQSLEKSLTSYLLMKLSDIKIYFTETK